MLDLQSDEDDKDQNENELELIRPKIELDVTQVQDRDDDPSFEEDEKDKKVNVASEDQKEMDNEDLYMNQIIKQETDESNKQTETNDETDEILALLMNEKYEILPDLTSKKEKPFHESIEPQEEIEDPDHPLRLADYVISYP